MTDKPEDMEPDATGPENDPLADALMGVMVGRGRPVSAAAAGVGAMIEATAEFVEDRQFAKIGEMHTPQGDVLPFVLTPGGGHKFISQSEIDMLSDAPRWRRGTATMTSLDSFITHVNRFGDDDSAVFADDSKTAPSLMAVLDYHRKDTLPTTDDEQRVHGDYQHGRHRTKFAFPVSDEWQAWHASDGQKMNMADFSVFLENNVLDVAEIDAVPASAERFVTMNGGPKMIADWSTLTSLAKTLAIYESGVVREIVNLASGEGELTLATDHDTEIAGVKTKVPTMFFIAIPIFRDGAIYRLPVRLRYRKSGAGVVFWYELYRADKAFSDAFREAVNRVATETEAQVFFGSPEA